MTNTYIPGPGEDGYALRDEEAAAEALGYPAEQRELSDQDEEQRYFEEHPEELARVRAEEAYAEYEALTDHHDEAELLAQEAEGQDVGEQFVDRARELRDVVRELGLPPADHGAGARPECEAFYDPMRVEAEAER